ncbi:hypothetical protein [Marinomonas primoryensis]|jgi:chromosome segregation ATPase|uniref:hypothetical protein n=1 Tax=Marinomonas primoryensis TaxID=178399 RepID=UPI0037046CE2
MKRTWQQGENAYLAGVPVEEVKADLENNAEWVMGWLFAQGKALEAKLLKHHEWLTKHEASLDKHEEKQKKYIATLEKCKKECSEAALAYGILWDDLQVCITEKRMLLKQIEGAQLVPVVH